MNDMELLSPAGSFETALAAFAAGADAVYLGLDAFSARADAVNFTIDQLRNLLAVAHRQENPKKVYVTFNTLLDDAQLPAAIEKLAVLEELGPDGVIVQDLGIARLVRRHFPGLELHASTQLVAHNLEGVLALREMGFVRVVLARELSVADIRSIAKRCGCEIEVFVHGALCYSLSGLCLFSALEKNRSGNRGACAYCCRLSYTDAAGNRSLPFSMRDLRLDDHLEQLRDAGVASLKIEGRMKSPLYVSTVTAHYRELLDGRHPETTRADLETVFSRRTTTLYSDGYTATSPVIDPSSLGHLGTPIGTVKRLTKDREGRTWLRFHTTRALERHDGLQFVSEGGKPYGFGISDMRVAISRSTVFSVKAGSDVEILVPEEAPRRDADSRRRPQPTAATAIHPGATVYCSASNEVRRRFPVPSFRPSDVSSGTPVDVAVTLAPDGMTASTAYRRRAVSTFLPITLTPSQHPERTEEAVRRALARMGGTDWALGSLALADANRLFAPASALNDLRRQLVEQLDAVRLEARQAKIEAAQADAPTAATAQSAPARVLKIRLDQPLPDDVCAYDELVVAIGHASGKDVESTLMERTAALRARAEESHDPAPVIRLALPVFTFERDTNALRSTVKHMVRAGVAAWEAADLAGLRMLTQLGLVDITADWSLYSLNRQSIAQLAELGVTRCVASPENTPENLQWLADARGPLPIEFLVQQNTPLFISLTRPAAEEPSLLTGLRGDTFTSFMLDGLWVTSRTETRRFRIPGNAASTRVDLSWDA
ncbi:MAG: DUF3656 domain-containing protein [Kiritimatiellia bacterium]